MAGNPCEAVFAEINRVCSENGKAKAGKLLRCDPSQEPAPGENEPARLKRIADARLARANELLDFESHSAKPSFSLGVVKDDEKLRRALREKDDFDGTNQSLSSTAFSDLDELGLSVDRHSRPLKESRNDAKKLEEKKGKPYRRYIEIDVNWLRLQVITLQPINKTIRCIGIYDTALETNNAHAEAFLIARQSGAIPLRDLQINIGRQFLHTLREWPAEAA